MLYLIIPYFNFENNFYREKNLNKFLQKNTLLNNLKLILVEAVNKKEKNYFNHSYNIYKHLVFETDSKIWIKENLMNLGLRAVPENCEYVGWIDSDLEFKSNDWIEKVFEKLKRYDAIQLFENLFHLDEQGNLINDPYMKENFIKNQYGLPGGGWAFKKNILNKIGGFFDYDIVGMGDNFMARCLINKKPFINYKIKNKVKNIRFLPTSKNYYEILNNYYKKCKNIKVSYLECDVQHHWHGNLNSRLYLERWSTLEEYEYDPIKYLVIKENGLIELNENHTDFKKDLEYYFFTKEETEKRLDTSKYKVVIGLTTTPSRISKIYPTIQTLINQSRKANRIILSLADKMARTGETFETIPNEIKNLVEAGELEIHKTKDYGPATKYVGLLEAESDPEAFFIWCDDDMEYNSEMITSLLNQSIKHPKSAMAMCAFNMIKNDTEYEIVYKNGKEAEILEGFSGVICRRKDMPEIENWKPVTNFEFKKMDAIKKAFFLGDDCVLSYLLRQKNIKTLACRTYNYNRSNGLKMRDINFGEDALRTNKYTGSNMHSYAIIKKSINMGQNDA